MAHTLTKIYVAYGLRSVNKAWMLCRTQDFRVVQPKEQNYSKTHLLLSSRRHVAPPHLANPTAHSVGRISV